MDIYCTNCWGEGWKSVGGGTGDGISVHVPIHHVQLHSSALVLHLDAELLVSVSV